MKKIFLQELDSKGAIQIAITDTATIYQLKNGSILKLYNPGVVEIQKLPGIDIDVERKILSARPVQNSPEILIPEAAVYDKNGKFCGYIMPKANGIDFNKYDDQLTFRDRENLTKYAEMHYQLEMVLRKNNDIFFPDFCTCDNIFVDSQNNIQFIDYDGLQIGAHRTLSLSTSVGGTNAIINNPKYFTRDRYFTKDLDKKSSIHLFYLTAFNIDLNKIGVYNPFSGKYIKLDDIFEQLGLDDQDICHKTWKVFNNKSNNEYLGEDLLTFAEKYDLSIVFQNRDLFVKKLTRKK